MARKLDRIAVIDVEQTFLRSNYLDQRRLMLYYLCIAVQ